MRVRVFELELNSTNPIQDHKPSKLLGVLFREFCNVLHTGLVSKGIFSLKKVFKKLNCVKNIVAFTKTSFDPRVSDITLEK